MFFQVLLHPGIGILASDRIGGMFDVLLVYKMMSLPFMGSSASFDVVLDCRRY